MKENRQSTTSPNGRSLWPIATVLIVAILTGAGLFLAVRLSQVPREALRGSQELLRDLQDVASAFRSGTIEVSFESFTRSLEGSNRLQFATLEQTETFKLTDRATVFWGAVDLPDVVVSATAPVEYTAYLDLDDRWDFQITEDRVVVTAPPIQFNKPAIDVSRIRYVVEQESWLRDEETVVEALRTGLTEMSAERIRDHLPMVREIGREESARFVSNWLVQSFSDGTEYEVVVRFQDESIVGEPASELGTEG